MLKIDATGELRTDFLKYRIMERAELEGSHKDHRVQFLYLQTGNLSGFGENWLYIFSILFSFL